MKKRLIRTTAIMAAIVYIVTFASGTIGSLVALLIHLAGFLSKDNVWIILLIPPMTSILLGFLFSMFFGEIAERILTRIMAVMRRVARGDYTATLDETVPLLEFREIAVGFNSMTRDIAETKMLHKDFMENLAHEIKTPITYIEGYATLLQYPDLTETQRLEYAQKIITGTKRLNMLTGSILLLSRLENQEYQMAKECYSLDEQIRECILLLEHKWNDKQIEMEINLEECDCLANRELMARVWQNLVDNAIKFTPSNGRIRINLFQSEDHVLVDVSDNGSGMTQEVKQRIFEKFYQSDAGRAAKGNGLGLALVKRIIDLHGGTIEVESQVDVGSVFTIKLPL